MSTAVITAPVEDTEQIIETSTDKPECAHIVVVPPDQDDESPHAYVMRARIEGFAITALCGYTWVPRKMATGLPVCEDCKTIFDAVSNPNGGFPHE